MADGMGGAATGAVSGAAAGSAFGPWGTAIGAGIGAIGGYLSSRQQAEQEDRANAIKIALAQREQQLNALQNTNREYDTAYNSIFNAANRSLSYH